MRSLLRWLDDADVEPLAADQVPGASEDELRRLAALGALARALAPDAIDTWPPVLAKWASTSADLDPAVFGEIEAILADPAAADALALTYEWVVSGTNRRRLGTFFTPPGLTQHMVEQATGVMDRLPDHVVDPGAGVGAFTIAARMTWPQARVTAIDINVVTLGLLAARLHHTEDDDERHLTLADDDYLVWLAEQWPDLLGPRLILGNPPYTRHQQMSANDKEKARKAGGQLITSGLAGLSAYFLAASLLALDPGDSLCLLLPGSWCETRYGREIREWLWHQPHRKVNVDLFPSRVEVFPGTQVTAMVLTVGPQQDTSQAFRVREADLVGNEVALNKTVHCDRTSACPATFTGVLKDRHVASDCAEPLGDHARIRRGVATGASDFFFLSDATRSTWNLPEDTLRAALVKPAHMLANHLTVATHDAVGQSGKPRWLLDLNGRESLVTDDACVQAYLAVGQELELDQRYLTKIRPHWWMVEQVQPPDLFLAPVGKDLHRVIVNDIKAVGSNNLYGIYLNDAPPWTPAALAAWLRSPKGQEALSHLARSYQGGSQKLEPKALRDLLIPTGQPATLLF